MESDPDDWPARAADDSGLVAATLLHLSRASWPPPPPPPTKWGSRAPRSRSGTGPPPRIDLGKKVRRRPSPMTPLEYRAGCGTSESGSEEIAAVLKRSGVSVGGSSGGGGRETKVVNAGDLQPSDFRISDAKRIRRSSTTIKKQALPELHAMYRSLLDYRESLLKELEVRRRVKAALVSKNIGLERLQTNLESQKSSITAAQIPEEVPPKRLRNTFEELPDLNIPVIGESD